MRLPRLPLGLLILLAPAGPLLAQSYFAHADWAAACDTSRTCTALALPPASAEKGMDLVLLRGGGSLEPVAWIDLGPREGLPLEVSARLFADERELFPLGDAHLLVDAIAEGRADQLRITRPEEIATLLSALRSASRIRIVASGRVVGESSAVGASAALLWIDEQQDRLERVNALIRHGERSAEAGFRPPAVPAPLPHRPAQGLDEGAAALAALAAAHRRLPEGWCEPRPAEERSDRVWRLNRGKRLLVEIDCARSREGAVTRWFLVERGEARPLVFRRPAIARKPAGMVELEALVNAAFDPLRGEIRSLEGLRAREDCGRLSVFRDDGADFVLSEDRYLDRCRGAPPDRWPVLYLRPSD